MSKYSMLFFFLLTACANPGGITANTPINTLLIDNTEYHVQKIPNTENGWGANKANLWGGSIDPADYLLNIKAIEKHTGCKVVPATITNKGMNTTAHVECPQ